MYINIVRYYSNGMPRNWIKNAPIKTAIKTTCSNGGKGTEKSSGMIPITFLPENEKWPDSPAHSPRPRCLMCCTMVIRMPASATVGTTPQTRMFVAPQPVVLVPKKIGSATYPRMTDANRIAIAISITVPAISWALMSVTVPLMESRKLFGIGTLSNISNHPIQCVCYKVIYIKDI